MRIRKEYSVRDKIDSYLFKISVKTPLNSPKKKLTRLMISSTTE